MHLNKRIPAANFEFVRQGMFEGEAHACEIAIRREAAFRTRSDRTDERFRRYVMPYLARVTFNKNSELLTDLFDTPEWMVAITRLPETMETYFETKNWWVSLYSRVVGNSWRNMDSTEAPKAFPEDVVQWIIGQCMAYHFFSHGGAPCPLT